MTKAVRLAKWKEMISYGLTSKCALLVFPAGNQN